MVSGLAKVLLSRKHTVQPRVDSLGLNKQRLQKQKQEEETEAGCTLRSDSNASIAPCAGFLGTRPDSVTLYRVRKERKSVSGVDDDEEDPELEPPLTSDDKSQALLNDCALQPAHVRFSRLRRCGSDSGDLHLARSREDSFADAGDCNVDGNTANEDNRQPQPRPFKLNPLSSILRRISAMGESAASNLGPGRLSKQASLSPPATPPAASSPIAPLLDVVSHPGASACPAGLPERMSAGSRSQYNSSRYTLSPASPQGLFARISSSLSRPRRRSQELSSTAGTWAPTTAPVAGPHAPTSRLHLQQQLSEPAAAPPSAFHSTQAHSTNPCRRVSFEKQAVTFSAAADGAAGHALQLQGTVSAAPVGPTHSGLPGAVRSLSGAADLHAVPPLSCDVRVL